MEYNLLDLGGITVTWLNGGEFKLDGGAMFGVVPKILWSRRYPADERQSHRHARRTPAAAQRRRHYHLRHRSGQQTDRKQQQIYRVSRPWQVEADLARLGLTPEDITAVVLTHCDFDHAGGIVALQRRGRKRTDVCPCRAHHPCPGMAVHIPRPIQPQLFQPPLHRTGGQRRLELIDARPGVRTGHTHPLHRRSHRRPPGWWR